MDDQVRIKAAVGYAFDKIKKRAPEEYSMLDTDSMNKISQKAESTARETFKLTYELEGNPEDIQKLLDKHLSKKRITLLNDSSEDPTFQTDIKKVDGKHWLKFTREGREFLPSKVLEGSDDVDWEIIQQYAGIWIGAVRFVMCAVGIPIPVLRNDVIKETVNKTAKAIQSSSKLQNALKAFVEAWNATEKDPMKKAEAIFNLLKDPAEMLWIIIKSLCSSMELYDWILSAVQVIVMIYVARETDGVVLIAEISVVKSAVDLFTKIGNLLKLIDIKKEM